ncbi:hypothetical protein [uncultured Helicobacter sp.]
MYARVSGGVRSFALNPDTNLPRANCSEIIESKTTSDIIESKKS